MNKEFVPYQPSLDMKELGFDEPCFKYYSTEISRPEETLFETRGGYEPEDSEIPAPLLQQAFRWFRENYNLMFQIFYLHNGNHAAIIHRTTPEYMDLVDQVRPSSCVDEVVDCYSYEEAELECLKTLIEIVKNK
jgi:hypothetical protein